MAAHQTEKPHDEHRASDRTPADDAPDTPLAPEKRTLPTRLHDRSRHTAARDRRGYHFPAQLCARSRVAAMQAAPSPAWQAASSLAAPGGSAPIPHPARNKIAPRMSLFISHHSVFKGGDMICVRRLPPAPAQIGDPPPSVAAARRGTSTKRRAPGPPGPAGRGIMARYPTHPCAVLDFGPTAPQRRGIIWTGAAGGYAGRLSPGPSENRNNQ